MNLFLLIKNIFIISWKFKEIIRVDTVIPNVVPLNFEMQKTIFSPFQRETCFQRYVLFICVTMNIMFYIHLGLYTTIVSKIKCKMTRELYIVTTKLFYILWTFSVRYDWFWRRRHLFHLCYCQEGIAGQFEIRMEKYYVYYWMATIK